MKPSMYPIAAQCPGQLYIMPKPSGEWIEEDIQHYKFVGVDTVISMLEHAEIKELSLQMEEHHCLRNDIEFLNFPIPDRGLPNMREFKAQVSAVRARLLQGKSVAVHCRAGIGRSGMLVCCALSEFVGSPTEAIQIVSDARGVMVPDTTEQRAFIETVATEIGG